MHSAREQPTLSTISVCDLADPRLEPYRNQKDAWLRAQAGGGTGLGDGLFLAEGELVVRALLESGHEVRSVLCTPARLEALRGVLAPFDRRTPVFVAERDVLESIVGFDLHRGVLAAGRRAAPPDASELIERAGLLVLCEDLANHDNVGAIFRNIACLAGSPTAGSHSIPAAVLLSPRCCDPLYRKALRVSMGHALRVPFARLEPWPEAFDRIRDARFELVAMTPDATAIPIQAYERSPNTRPALLLGAEGGGLRAASLGRSDRRVRIPMAAGADSLNVATALAVVLAHLQNLEKGEPAGPAGSQ